jgi:LPPG:FO 2-phospho-L-lactate transferase
MCDEEVQTEVRTASGWQPFQEFLVRDGAASPVVDVRQRGLDAASLTDDARAALATATLIVIGPSSPVASVLPILGVPGLRAALLAADAPVVAVTPVVGSLPIRDPGEARRARCRGALLRAVGLEHRATSVATLYQGLVDRFVLDAADAAEAEAVAATGCAVVEVPTLTHVDPGITAGLVGAVLGTPARTGRRGRPAARPAS